MYCGSADTECEDGVLETKLEEREQYVATLSTQLLEIEMLQSIYSKPGEIKIDEEPISAANEFLKHKSSLPAPLNFTINLSVNGCKLEVCISLPHLYPIVKPEILSINSSLLSGQQYAKLLDEIDEYIVTLLGDSCLYSIIVWIQDYVTKIPLTNNDNNSCINDVSDSLESKTFSRFWIHSHHIYNKEKRKQILNLAQQFNLSGFCLSGKPGIVCIEGLENDCNEWWHTIKRMTWKKIACLNVEEDKLIPNEKCDHLRKFNGFQEINMDMRALYLYLVDHNCDHVFKLYFGFEGKTSTK